VARSAARTSAPRGASRSLGAQRRGNATPKRLELNGNGAESVKPNKKGKTDKAVHRKARGKLRDKGNGDQSSGRKD
jgi:hypothetical protein